MDGTEDTPTGDVVPVDDAAPQGYESKLADLSSLSDEDLAALDAEVVAAFDAADESQDMDAMSATAAALDQVRAESASRGTAADDEGAETVPDDETSEGDTSDSAPEEIEAVAASAATGDDSSTPEPEAPAEDAAPEPPVTAGGATSPDKEPAVEIPEDRKPVATPSVTTITAGADIPGKSAGTPFASQEEVNKAMADRINSLRGATGDGVQHTVATLTASFPEDRVLESGDLEGNMAKIKKVTDPEAIVAAGGYCAPLEVRYDIFGLGVTDRPIRDALARFGADRGGVRFTPPPVISGLNNAVGLWTAANDISPSSPTTKPCLTVACTAAVDVFADAITLCLQFGNLMTRAYPELVGRYNELGLINWSRFAERYLLTQIGAASISVSSAQVLGTARDWLFAVGRGAAMYRLRHRMDPEASLRVLAPAWVRDAIREDIAYGYPGDDAGNLAIADTEINGYLASRNVNVAWHLDGQEAAQGVGQALNDFPTTIPWYLFAEGTFLHLDGGTLDIGVVRDGTLVGTNDYKMFTESFEGVAMVGVESLKVTTTTKVLGKSSLAVTTS